MIDVISVSGGYDRTAIIKDMTFRVNKGEFFGIIGPNGSGKTTLLHMVSQILPVMSGQIMVKGQSVSAYNTKEFARIAAVLPQNMVQAFSYTVKETVSLGRYAHQQGLFHTLSQFDQEMIEQVMVQTGIKQYEHEPIDHLSGGERQRVFLAQALAQDPEILLLDEPTNHLDLAYQKELLDVLKNWTRERDMTVVSIFHDLNLAGLYCDTLLLMDDGKKMICGTPDDVLKKDRIEAVYGAEIEHHPHPKVPKPQMMLIPSRENMEKLFRIDEQLLHVTKDKITLETTYPLKTMSSGVTGSGVGWHRHFVNRYVSVDYDCAHYKQEMNDFLKAHGIHPEETVSMMTAVELKDVAYQLLETEDENLSVFVVATAASGNAVDASKGFVNEEIENKNANDDDVSNKGKSNQPGTINLWIFVNGELTDEAFIQSMITATEAKVKALQTMNITVQSTNTLATGTPTDSILIAATQHGKKMSFGGPVTQLGCLIGKGVYECIIASLEKYFARENGLNNDG